MNVAEILERELDNNGGVLRVANVAPSVTRASIAAFVKQRNLERIVKGVYVLPDAWVDHMELLASRSRNVIFSHETALELHGLSDRESSQMNVTVPSGYNSSSLKRAGIKVYFVKRELHRVGAEVTLSPDGAEIPVYNMERTICDILRQRKSFSADRQVEALKSYMRSTKRNLVRLDEYSRIFGVSRILLPKIEVLL